MSSDLNGRVGQLQNSWLKNVKFEHLLAGTTGGVASTLVLHPLDLIKIRFQGDMQYKSKYSSNLELSCSFCVHPRNSDDVPRFFNLLPPHGICLLAYPTTVCQMYINI